MSSPKYHSRLFINNEWVDSISGATFPTVNPATEEIICQVQEGREADVDKAVKAAREALSGPWGTMSAYSRGQLMYKLADLMEKNKDELGRIESVDNGKPLAACMAYDIGSAIKVIRYYAGWADKVQGKVIPVEGPYHCFTRHEPVGVVGAVIPWNFPLMLMSWKLGPALAAGCTMVIKPAEQTPLTALHLGQLVIEAGFPPGVINIVPGFGAIAGNAISHHMDIDKISFTGSTRVGKLILEASAKSNLKKVTLELGGKSPNIVFGDCDFEKAVEGAWQAIFVNMGQNCCAGSRLFVQADIYDRFVKALTERTGKMKIGDPFTEVDQGPLVSKDQFDRVLGYIAAGKNEGAKVACGGARHGDKGYYVAPTLFFDVQDNMTIAREEIFGPVLSVLKFETEEEVIKRANSTEFGLAGGVWTQNMSRAHRVANAIKAGTIWMNDYNVVQPNAPFGGFKQTGFGKDLGEYAIQEYLSIKTVYAKY
eukprot:TRINITY_DN4811_c0_g1_i1.p1 TRINITY_DN4811_c0_g1~~TRINITY_DN4811_c0_g1_i1.p1  ORF type:complete len:481 (+),score=146.16 TRINITY_DN4811_c0_g1_i1:176-1618(+)